MEAWQRRHIKKQMPDLIDMTTVSPTFLARFIQNGVFCDADYDDLESIPDDTKRALKFYLLIQKRSNAYDDLIQALVETKQSGAAKILRDGKSRQRTTSINREFDMIQAFFQMFIERVGNASDASELIDEVINFGKQLLDDYFTKRANPDLAEDLMSTLETSDFKNVKQTLLHSEEKLISRILGKLDGLIDEEVKDYVKSLETEVFIRSPEEWLDFHENEEMPKRMSRLVLKCNSFVTTEALKEHAQKLLKERCTSELKLFLQSLPKSPDILEQQRNECIFCTDKQLKLDMQKFYVNQIDKHIQNESIYSLDQLNSIHEQVVSASVKNIGIKSELACLINGWCVNIFETLKIEKFSHLASDPEIILAIDFGASKSTGKLLFNSSLDESVKAEVDTIITVRDKQWEIGRRRKYCKNTIYDLKQRILCEPNQESLIFKGKLYLTKDLISTVFINLKKSVERQIRLEVDKAIITVPSCWNERKINCLKGGAEKAGFAFVQINKELNAIVSFVKTSINFGREPVFIISLGASTCSAIIVSDDKIFEASDPSLGGDMIDKKIIKYCLDNFRQINSLPSSYEPTAKNLHRLKIECEDSKKLFGVNKNVNIELEKFWNNKNLEVNINQEVFEKMVSSLFDKIISSCVEPA